jgi:carboxyl-terminal processing protease
MAIKQKIIFLFLISFLSIAIFFAGFLVGKTQVVCPICPPKEIDFSLFWEAYHKLQERFIDREKLNIQKIIYGAITGMVKSLEDPYTIFLPPEETKRFIEDVKGTFEGVGMEIGIRKGQLQVIAPLEGTPAQKAGLRSGDKIMEIDKKSTLDMTIEEAVNLIRGPKGTQVTLTIFREGWEEARELKITRAVIEIPSLKWEIKEEDIVYLRLYHFTEKAGNDFKIAAFKILNSPAKKIILDLRNNPGGYLEVAQDIAGWFLKKGQVVTIKDFGENKEKEKYLSQGPSRLLEYPLVILINEGSASGSEILAGALRDNRGIILIGKKTFGKGSIQELENLRGGSSLKITIARWLTPKGKLISDIGLEPDIIVEMTEKDYEEERDPQLDKAIEVIREMR